MLLSDSLPDLQRERGVLVADGQRDFKQLGHLSSAVRAAQDAAGKAKSAAADEASKLEKAMNTPRIKDKDRAKAREKSEASATKLAACNEALARCEAEEADTQHALYEIKLPQLLESFEAHEERRASMVLSAGLAWGELHEEATAASVGASEALTAQLALIDPEVHQDGGHSFSSGRRPPFPTPQPPREPLLLIWQVDLREHRSVISRSAAHGSIRAAELLRPMIKGRISVCTLAAGKPLGASRWRQRLCILHEQPAASVPAADEGETPCALYIYCAENSSTPEEALALPCGGGTRHLRALHSSVLGRPHVLELAMVGGERCIHTHSMGGRWALPLRGSARSTQMVPSS